MAFFLACFPSPWLCRLGHQAFRVQAICTLYNLRESAVSACPFIRMRLFHADFADSRRLKHWVLVYKKKADAWRCFVCVGTSSIVTVVAIYGMMFVVCLIWQNESMVACVSHSGLG